MTELGDLGIGVQLDLEGLEQQLQQLEAYQAKALKLKLELDETAINQQIKALKLNPITVSVRLDSEQIKSELLKLKQLQDADNNLTLKIDTAASEASLERLTGLITGAKEEVEALQRELEGLRGGDVLITPRIDRRALRESLKADGVQPTANVDARFRRAQVQEELDQLDNLKVYANVIPVIQDERVIVKKLQRIGQTPINPVVTPRLQKQQLEQDVEEAVSRGSRLGFESGLNKFKIKVQDQDQFQKFEFSKSPKYIRNDYRPDALISKLEISKTPKIQFNTDLLKDTLLNGFASVVKGIDRADTNNQRVTREGPKAGIGGLVGGAAKQLGGLVLGPERALFNSIQSNLGQHIGNKLGGSLGDSLESQLGISFEKLGSAIGNRLVSKASSFATKVGVVKDKDDFKEYVSEVATFYEEISQDASVIAGAQRRYRENYAKAAERVKVAGTELAQTTAPIADGKEQVTFVSGGFANKGGKHAEQDILPLFQKNNLLQNHDLRAFDNKESDTDYGLFDNPGKWLGNAIGGRVLRQSIRGYNKDAESLATQAYAQQLVNPETPINLYGVSGGTPVVSDAQQILKQAGVSVKAAGNGGPTTGLLNSPNQEPGDFRNFQGKLDPVGIFPLIGRDKNAEFLKDPLAGIGHFTGNYFNRPEFRDKLTDFYGTPESRANGITTPFAPTPTAPTKPSTTFSPYGITPFSQLRRQSEASKAGIAAPNPQSVSEFLKKDTANFSQKAAQLQAELAKANAALDESFVEIERNLQATTARATKRGRKSFEVQQRKAAYIEQQRAANPPPATVQDQTTLTPSRRSSIVGSESPADADFKTAIAQRKALLRAEVAAAEQLTGQDKAAALLKILQSIEREEARIQADIAQKFSRSASAQLASYRQFLSSTGARPGIKQGAEQQLRAFSPEAKFAAGQQLAQSGNARQSALDNFATGLNQRPFNPDDVNLPRAAGVADLALKAVKTDELPSRREILQGVRSDFTSGKVLDFKAGNERERQLRQVAPLVVGQQAPTRLQVAQSGFQRVLGSAVSGVKKFATSDDTLVNTAGFLSSVAGNAIGGLPLQLAGDLGGALIARKGLRDFRAVRETLKEQNFAGQDFTDGSLFRSLNNVRKGAIAKLRTPEAQLKTREDLVGDVSGFLIGNAAAGALGGVPGLGGVPFKGAAVALGTVPTVLEADRKGRLGATPGQALKQTAIEVAQAPGRFIAKGNEREALARQRFTEQLKQRKAENPALAAVADNISLARAQDLGQSSSTLAESAIQRVKGFFANATASVAKKIGLVRDKDDFQTYLAEVSTFFKETAKGANILKAAQQRYQQNYIKAAERVRVAGEALAASGSIPTLAEGKEQITLVSGGFAGKKGRAAQDSIVPHFEQESLLPNHDLRPFANRRSDVDYGADQNLLKFAVNGIGGRLTRNVIRGHNPDSEALAAQAYAHQLVNPGVPINLLGHSGGAPVVSDAQQLLKGVGVNVKAAGFGGATTGFINNGLQKPGEYKNFVNRLDPVSLFGTLARDPNAIPVTDGGALHTAGSYARSQQFRTGLNAHFDGGTEKTDAVSLARTGEETTGIKGFINKAENVGSSQSGRIDKLKAFLGDFGKKQRLDLDQTYKLIVEEVAKNSGVALKPGDIPKLQVNNEKLKNVGATALYEAKENQIIITQEIADLLGSTIRDLEKGQTKIAEVVHEVRHAAQLNFGQTKLSELSAGTAQPGVTLADPYSASETSQSHAKASVAIANAQAGQTLPQNVQRTISGLEIDAYEYEQKTPQIVRNVSNQLRSQPKRIAKTIQSGNVEGEEKAPLTGLEKVARKAQRLKKSFEFGYNIDAPFKKLNEVFPGLIGNLGTALKGFLSFAAIGIVTQQLAQFSKESFQAFVRLDNLKTSLKFATGGDAGGASALKFINAEATRLRIPLEASAKGFTQLAAATRGTATEGKATREVFTGISEAATVLGLSSDDVQGSLLALSQVSSKGVVSSEELRQQLAEKIPSAMSIAARSMNVTDAAFGKLLDSGQILAQDFLPKFGKQLSAEFGDEAKSAAGNAQSAIFNLNNTFVKLQQTLGGLAAVAVVPIMNTLSSVMGGLAGNSALLVGIIGTVAIALAVSLAAALTAPIAGTTLLSLGIGALSASFGALSKVILQFQTQILVSGAFVALAALIAGVSSSINTDLVNSFNKAADAAGRVANASRDIRLPENPQNKDEDKDKGKKGKKGKDIFSDDEETPLVGLDNIFASEIAFEDGGFQFRKQTGRKPGTTYGDLQKTNLDGALSRETGNANQFIADASLKLSDLKDGKDTTLATLEPQLLQAENERKTLQANADRDYTRKGLSVPVEQKTAIEAAGLKVDELNKQRSDAAKPYQTDLLGANKLIDQTKGQIAALKDDDETIAAVGGRKSADDKIGKLQVLLDSLKKFKAESETIQTGLRVDPLLTLGEAFKKLTESIDGAKRATELFLVTQKGDIARKQKKDFGTDEDAGRKATTSQLETEQKGTEQELDSTKEGIKTLESTLDRPDVNAALKTYNVSKDSTLEEVEKELKATDDSEANKAKKTNLERLKGFLELKRRVPQLETTLAEQDVKLTEDKQQNALTVIDRDTTRRDQTIKQDDDRRAIPLRKASADLVRDKANNKFFSESDAAVAEANLGVKAAQNQVTTVDAKSDSTQQTLDDLNAQKAAGTVGAEEYNRRQRELTTQLADLRVEKANAAAAVEEALAKKVEATNRKVIEGLELANQKASAAIQLSETNQTTGTKKRLLAAGLTDRNEKVAGIEQTGIDETATQQRNKLIQKEIQDYKKLAAEKRISGKELTEKLLQFNQELADNNGKLVDLQISKQKQLRDLFNLDVDRKVAADNRGTQSAIRNLERQKAAAEAYSKSLDISKKLTQSKADLQSAISAYNQVVGQGAVDRESKKLDIANKAENEQDPTKKEGYEKIARSLGVSDPSDKEAILDAKQAAEKNLADIKQRALESEYALKQQLLELDLKRDKLQAQQAVREAQIAELNAKKEVTKNTGELRKAIKEGDPEKIADARSNLDDSLQAYDISKQNTASAQEGLASTDQLAADSRAKLGVERDTAFAQAGQEQQNQGVNQAVERVEAGLDPNGVSGGSAPPVQSGNYAGGSAPPVQSGNYAGGSAPPVQSGNYAGLGVTRNAPTSFAFPGKVTPAPDSDSGTVQASGSTSSSLSSLFDSLTSALTQRLDVLIELTRQDMGNPRSVTLHATDPVESYADYQNRQSGNSLRSQPTY